MSTELPPSYLLEFAQAILKLDSELSEDRPNLDLEQAATILAELHNFKDSLKMVYDGFAKSVSDLMGDLPEVNLPNGTKIEKNSSPSRKAWKHKDLANEVAARLKDMSVDMDTGEIVLTSEEMVVKMLDYVYPSYWKVKELGKIGINADKFSEVGEVKDSIIVRKAK